jgi:hypothetical protein
MTPEQELMTKIKTDCGPWIKDAIDGTPYPAELLAAITANESGGDPRAQRFEPKVFGHLAQVLVGQKANYGAIGGEDLAGQLPKGIRDAILQLMSYATSYGPTQIMGYEALVGGYNVAELPNLQTHYRHAVKMLEDFDKRYQLSARNEWGLFFHCWNDGSPTAPTEDPAYTSRGLDRMGIYKLL